ncbi:Hsp20/alpha crystallin family protein [Halobacillus kuroshimensis]|uniref:Hsp20/alpha crystallin family protein n=1 Tax=Halobacillus kuroshimensis TaxID=302481 RepID=UPI0003FD58B5|nr:Hsp20/alpha crystallin family protein [Halobacillus kuroshimensis]
MMDFMKWFNPVGGEDGGWNGPVPNWMNGDKMNDFLQQSMKEALSSTPFHHEPHLKKEQELDQVKVVELMNEVVVTVALSHPVDPDMIRLSVGSGYLYVEGVEAGRMTIKLPAATSRRNVYAQYREGRIEIRLQKKQTDEKEIFLHY